MARNLVLHILVDLIVLGLVSIPLFVYEFGIQPFHRGFFCDDESIKHPYQQNTVTNGMLIGMGIAIPVISMLICEAVLYMRHKYSPIYSPQKLGKFNIHPYVWICYKTIGVLGFGGLVCQLATDTTKYTVGRLRPHFLTACDPDWSLVNCTSASGAMRYVTEDVCRGDVKILKEARLSFPSGHASFSTYLMVYLALYIQSRFTWQGSRLLKPFLQILALSLALLTCYSRISDYKHHWSDVLGGFLYGVFIAMLVAFFISDLFKPGPKFDESNPTQEDTQRNYGTEGNGRQELDTIRTEKSA